MSNDAITLRLQRANPVPRHPEGDRAALFARITAEAGDPRLSAPPRPLRRRAGVLALAVVLAALLASTAYAVSQWVIDDTVVEPPVTRHEYHDAQQQLSLPPGATWPALNVPDNSVTTIGGGGGHAVLIAQNRWECYWVNAVRTGDAAAAAEAQAVLQGLLAHNMYEAPFGAPEGWVPKPLPDPPFAVFAHDGGLGGIRASYRRAAAGDIRNIAQSCRANR